MGTTGYSGTPLVKKLGIKPGFIIGLVDAPAHYFDLLPGVRDTTVLSEDRKTKKDFIHFFCRNAETLAIQIPYLREELKENGMFWVSWLKKSSGIPTDVGEELIRQTALSNGLVDIKVCAVDETWSGLKLVIPIAFRRK